ncbi:MAG TPA: hypothetical protein DCE41_22305, partial [Cytophagales bacterium]|nr:hypothetical protein [Cytophagales bacterium]
MSDLKAHIALFPGRTARQGQLPALHPEYFQVEERTLPEQLARMAHVAQSFRFYNLKDQPQGSWAEYLLADPVFLAAVISQTDTQADWPRAKALFEAALRAKPGQSDDYWQHFFELGWQQVEQLNHWYTQTEKLIHASPLSHYLKQLIKTTAGPAWQRLYDDYSLLTSTWPSFHNALKSRIQLPALWAFSNMDGESEENPLVSDTWWSNLLLHMKALLELRQQVIEQAGKYLDEALRHSDMSPQTGLILSFLGLMEYPKALLNQATHKHLEYYYRQVLGMRPEPPTAGRTWLTFTLPPDGLPLELPAGTRFDAGTLDGEGSPRYAASGAPATLTAAR